MKIRELAQAADELLERAKKADLLALGLDYDGTLTPIRPTPEEALLSPEARRVLKALSGNHRVSLMLLTGRSADDLASIIGLPEIEIAGNHGLSRFSGGEFSLHPATKEFMSCKEGIRERLAAMTERIDCIRLEDKGPGFAIHYRTCPESTHEAVRSKLLEACRAVTESFPVRVQEGKKVVELVQRTEIDKGTTMTEWVSSIASEHAEQELLVLYAGDDFTDEDVFRVAPKDWIAIQVGEPEDRETSARYLASTTKELISFLALLQ